MRQSNNRQSSKEIKIPNEETSTQMRLMKLWTDVMLGKWEHLFINVTGAEMYLQYNVSEKTTTDGTFSGLQL